MLIREKSILTVISYLWIAFLVTVSEVHAGEVNFQASIDRDSLNLGQSAQLSLHFGGSSDVPAPELPETEGLQFRYVGPSKRMSFVNGRMSSSVTHIYKIVPLKTGKLQIGPFSFEHDNDIYTSNGLAVEVLDSESETPGHRGQQKKQEVNLSDRVFVKIHVGKSSPYINEIIPFTITLYVNGISIRDIQYPEFYHEGFSSGQFDKPRQFKKAIGGTIYDVVEFKTRIFPTREGEFVLGPARINANIVTQKKRRRRSFDDFFGTYETHPVEIKSEEISMHVLPLPLNGRPEDFRGAVGKFNFDLHVSPHEVKAGDPLTVKMTVSGTGNFNTVTSPELKQYEGFKTYKPQVKQEGNKKIFEQVLIPTSDTIDKFPVVSFSFFSSEKGQYQTITKGGMPLTVHRPDRKERITILEASPAEESRLMKEKFGRDIIYIKESPGRFRTQGRYLYNNVLFLIIQLIPVLLFISLWGMKKRKEKLSTDIGYARRLSAPRKARKGIREAERFLGKNNPPEFYSAVFRTVREYVGNRYHVSSGGITAEVAGELLTEKGINKDIVSRLKGVFRACDMARYAPSETGRTDMEGALRELKEIIDYLERHRG
jgi:hypothetical protein